MKRINDGQKSYRNIIITHEKREKEVFLTLNLIIH